MTWVGNVWQWTEDCYDNATRGSRRRARGTRPWSTDIHANDKPGQVAFASIAELPGRPDVGVMRSATRERNPPITVMQSWDFAWPARCHDITHQPWRLTNATKILRLCCNGTCVCHHGICPKTRPSCTLGPVPRAVDLKAAEWHSAERDVLCRRSGLAPGVLLLQSKQPKHGTRRMMLPSNLPLLE